MTSPHNRAVAAARPRSPSWASAPCFRETVGCQQGQRRGRVAAHGRDALFWSRGLQELAVLVIFSSVSVVRDRGRGDPRWEVSVGGRGVS